MSPTFKAKARRFAVSPLAGFVILLLFGVIGTTYQSHYQDEKANAAQIASCERGKQDRLDHARVYMAQATYWEGVLEAKSVKGDVKGIARRVHGAVEASAEGMRSRILLCGPLINDGKSVPDRRLLNQLPAH